MASRYTTDILKLTGAVGLPNPASDSYTLTRGVWPIDINNFLLTVDAEISLTYAGNPNGNVASLYIGRRLYDTVNKRIWVSQNIANTAGAIWEAVRANRFDKQYKQTTVSTHTINVSDGNVLSIWDTNVAARRTQNIPAGGGAGAAVGQEIVIKLNQQADADTYPIDIVPASGTIEGQSLLTLSNPGNYTRLINSIDGYIIIG